MVNNLCRVWVSSIETCLFFYSRFLFLNLALDIDLLIIFSLTTFKGSNSGYHIYISPLLTVSLIFHLIYLSTLCPSNARPLSLSLFHPLLPPQFFTLNVHYIRERRKIMTFRLDYTFSTGGLSLMKTKVSSHSRVTVKRYLDFFRRFCGRESRDEERGALPILIYMRHKKGIQNCLCIWHVSSMKRNYGFVQFKKKCAL